jgi:hypothetical protein
MEERWTSLWSAYASEALRGRGTLPPGGGDGQGGLPRPSSSYGNEMKTRLTDTDTSADTDTFARHISRNLGVASPLLDAASSIGLFSPFGSSQLAPRSSSSVDPATQAAALAQMTDMGLPRDWCEVALRRCRFNVELAINMCFESGSDMSRIVAEDALMQAAQASRREAEVNTARRHRPAREEPGREREEAPGLGRERDLSAAARIQSQLEVVALSGPQTGDDLLYIPLGQLPHCHLSLSKIVR